ncbi:hypothetical protein [Nocardioides mesophilus]|uniref:DoxX family membrane protein n=1 Tax=Nocardioides mesophilus TaxID=433659 RepID=A0A7G9REQ7_9ACTN|nr:hypothetical protein [Nocardioides mesophilus]QNN54082.1 hypothetical protein H9L09_06815 [Nocardioides mesophilus]
MSGAALIFPGAHERWFVTDVSGGDWSFFFSPLPLLLTAVVVAVTVAWRLVALRLPSPEIGAFARLGRLAPYVPRLLAIHVGVSLLALAATGDFLAHSLPLREVPAGGVVGLVEAGIGVWFITGVRLRAAAVGLVVLGPVALLAAGPVAMLESAALLGVAGFLAVLPPSDGTFGRVEHDAVRLRWALLALRLGVAVALVTLAFSEKLTNPVLATETLDAYPSLDVFALAGIHLAPTTFIAVAGAVELLFGLLVLSGAAPQVAVLVAAVPFNATLLLFGQTELVGHLPVYGVFLTLLVYGSSAVTAPEVRWLPRPRDLTVRRRAAVAAAAATP